MCPSGRSSLRSLGASASSTPDFRPAFDVLDVDRDGKISRDDLRTFYSGFFGDDGNEDIIGSMMTAADTNKDGFVEYEEFERVLLGNTTEKRPLGFGVMEDVFRVMDKDGDGKLSHEDLKSYMAWAGFAASDEDVKAMIKLGGGDGNGGVSFDGLLRILAVDFVG